MQTVDEYMSDEDLKFIDDMLEKYGHDDSVLDVSELDGFLTAVVSGPDMIPPSVWMPAIWGGEEHSPEWDSEAEFKRFLTLIMGHLNAIVDMLMSNDADAFEAIFKVNARSEEDIVIAEEWCFGYMRGVDLGNWPKMTGEAQHALELIELHGREEHFDKLEALSLKEHQAQVARIEQGAKIIHGYWLAKREHLRPKAPVRPLQRPIVSGPKVGRNDPCPCGSGKKYKQCCLH